MTYDASKEFTPFNNRGNGGQLIEEPSYKGHPNKKNYRRNAGKANTSRHAPNHRYCEILKDGSKEWTRADGSVVTHK